MIASTTPTPEQVKARNELMLRTVWVLNRTKVTPAEWDPTVLVVDRSAAYPSDTMFPTKVALEPLPGEDRWWGPDSDFVNEDADDGGFPLTQALVSLAMVTAELCWLDAHGDVKPWRTAERIATSLAWWERMGQDIWNEGGPDA